MPDSVEVSAERLDSLTRAEKLFNALWNDKEFGLTLKKEVKKHVPDARIPDLDIVETVTKPYDEKIAKLADDNKKLLERLDKYDEEKINSAEESAMSKELDRVRQANKFTDEGMKKVIERMKEKKNPDAEAAAAWVLAQEPKSSPVTPSSLGFSTKANLFGSNSQSDDWKELNLNPEAYADKEIASILSNPEQYREFGGSL